MNLDFKEEAGSLAADAPPVSVTEILYLADDAAPDVALLRIAGENLPCALPLAEREAVVGDLGERVFVRVVWGLRPPGA